MSIEITNYEDLSDDDFDMKSMMAKIDPIQVKGRHNKESNTIVFYDESVEDEDFSEEVVDTIEQLYESYNVKYGLSLKINVKESLATFRDIIDPRNRQIFELYLVESYGRFRLVAYQTLMMTSMNIMKDLSNPRNMNVPIQDKYIMLEKLFNFLEKINSIYDQIKTNFSDAELTRLAQEQNMESSDLLDYNDPEVLEVIEKLSRTVLESSSSNKDE